MSFVAIPYGAQTHKKVRHRQPIASFGSSCLIFLEFGSVWDATNVIPTSHVVLCQLGPFAVKASQTPGRSFCLRWQFGSEHPMLWCLFHSINLCFFLVVYRSIAIRLFASYLSTRADTVAATNRLEGPDMG